MKNFEELYNKHNALINVACLVAQISLFIIVHNISSSYFIKYEMFSSSDIGWGIRVEYIFYEFVFLFLAQCFFIYRYPQRMILISILTSLGVGLIILPYYGGHPFRVLHIGLEGLMCVWIHFIFKNFCHISNSSMK